MNYYYVRRLPSFKSHEPIMFDVTIIIVNPYTLSALGTR